MPTKEGNKKSPPPRNPALPGLARRVRVRSSARSAIRGGIIDKATKVVRSVVVAAVAGAADAVKGVAEAGSKITGIGSPTEDKSKSPKR